MQLSSVLFAAFLSVVAVAIPIELTDLGFEIDHNATQHLQKRIPEGKGWGVRAFVDHGCQGKGMYSIRDDQLVKCHSFTNQRVDFKSVALYSGPDRNGLGCGFNVRVVTDPGCGAWHRSVSTQGQRPNMWVCYNVPDLGQPWKPFKGYSVRSSW